MGKNNRTSRSLCAIPASANATKAYTRCIPTCSRHKDYASTRLFNHSIGTSSPRFGILEFQLGQHAFKGQQEGQQEGQAGAHSSSQSISRESTGHSTAVDAK